MPPSSDGTIQKISEITQFLSEILMIEESYKLIGREAQLAPPNQKWQSQMLTFFDDYLHAKNLRD